MNEEDVRNNLITFFRGNATLIKLHNSHYISEIDANIHIKESLETPIRVTARAYIDDFFENNYIESDVQTWLSTAFVDLSSKLESKHKALELAREQKLKKLRHEAARIGYELVEKERRVR